MNLNGSNNKHETCSAMLHSRFDTRQDTLTLNLKIGTQKNCLLFNNLLDKKNHQLL